MAINFGSAFGAGLTGVAGLFGLARLFGGGVPTARLQQLANGQGPNPVETMLRNNSRLASNQMLGQAGLDRSGNPSLALRNAQMAGSQVIGQAQAQAAQSRLQQQLAAEQMLQQINTANSQRDDKISGGLINGSAGGMGMLLSDERQKHNLSPVQGAMSAQEMLNQLQPTQFQYNGSNQPQTGITAQQLAATPAGQQALVQTPQGLAINPTTSMGPIFASLAQLNERLNAIDPTSVPAYQEAMGYPNRPVIEGPVTTIMGAHSSPLGNATRVDPGSYRTPGSPAHTALLAGSNPGMHWIDPKMQVSEFVEPQDRRAVDAEAYTRLLGGIDQQAPARAAAMSQKGVEDMRFVEIPEDMRFYPVRPAPAPRQATPGPVQRMRFPPMHFPGPRTQADERKYTEFMSNLRRGR